MYMQVSLASRIVPSPDWFVGLDSFNLCIDGQWVDSVAIKVYYITLLLKHYINIKNKTRTRTIQPCSLARR